MKLIKYIFFFLFFSSCFSYANENKYTFVGQNNEGKTAFILELVDDLGDNIQINENGEVYIKVDKIIAVSEENVTEYGGRVSTKPKTWKCPYCNRRWEFGEECKNEECATNQWKKKKAEGS